MQNLMNTLTKWNPFTAIAPTRSNLLRKLDSIEERLSSLISRNAPETASEWAGMGLDSYPAVDIQESNTEYILKADLPQVPKSEIKISTRNGMLEISGEKKTEAEEVGREFYRLERSYGSFQRLFGLPVGVDVSRAKAKLREGVLTITIPKTPEAASQAVDIPIH